MKELVDAGCLLALCVAAPAAVDARAAAHVMLRGEFVKIAD